MARRRQPGCARTVEAYLQEMAERTAGALVELMPRQPGEREARWRHCLSEPAGTATTEQGSAGHDAPSQPAANPADAEALQMLQQRVDDLERQVAALTERLARLES